MSLVLFSWFGPLALEGTEDLCVGVLLAAVVWTVAGARPTLGVLASGAIFAVLPDADLLWGILTLHIDYDHHRSPMHIPAIMLTVTALATYVVARYRAKEPWRWVLLGCICVLWHFLHDTPELGGGGIQWIWPLSHKYWSFHGTEVLRPQIVMMCPCQPIAGWTHPSTLAEVELTAGTVALLITSLILSLHSYRYVVAGVVLSACIWSAALLIWSANA